MKKAVILVIVLIVVGIGLFYVYRLFFSPERINILGRTIETTLGFENGIVEFYSCGKLIKRFLKVEKLTTAKGTYEKQTRPYRFGFGYIDINLDGILNKNEKEKGKVYFEIPSQRDYIYYDAKFIPEE
ncbi:hypothetical protein SAMN06265182_1663 [Persephonella hydrogeniphila]|uniref:Uncharacterized protein n=1 Tax=Persephonella hydrogeniphila TaxID=198703 RepID=A0A285NL14_9AQUI|nr:hypothetical protein [Persephonella hydrogeniphila]SNZ09918.1 hypothetical protein SAMN06265182_1663 [Persephonella hydrogeniphila]